MANTCHTAGCTTRPTLYVVGLEPGEPLTTFHAHTCEEHEPVTGAELENRSVFPLELTAPETTALRAAGRREFTR